MAHLLISQGEYGKARELILGGISLAQKSNRIYQEVELRILLAQAEIQVRRFSRAVDVLRPVFEMSERDIYIGAFNTVLHLSAVAALGSGDIDAAKRVGERLGKIIEKADYPKYIRRHEHLIGQIALAEGQPDQAIPHLERAVSMLPEQRENSDDDQAFFYDALAGAYYQSENLSKALEVYQAICALTTGRLEWGGLYARSYYWQGRIQQRMGHEAEAVAGFERFLRLWEEADGDLPEVIDARQQLKSLSSQIGPGRAPSVF